MIRIVRVSRMVDIRQTIQYGNYLSKIGWKVERIAEINYFIKKFPIIGSAIKIQRPEELRYKDIKTLSAKHRAFQIIVEPRTGLDAKYVESLGFKLSQSPYLPTKTLQLDLTKSKNQLLKEMRKDARHTLRKTMHYVVCSLDSVEDFRATWKKAVDWRRYVPPLPHLLALKTSFKKNCLFLAMNSHYRNSTIVQNNDAIAGGIFLLGDKVGCYWQAFTNEEGRKNLAQYKIVWEGIEWAKRTGARVFDFEGIYDERFPNKSWLGFTHFKKSFGGVEISYPGTYTKFLIPFGL